jgi:repressor LexA
MTNVNYIINKKNRPIFTPEITPVEAEQAIMTEIPLLGWVAAGVPVDLFENRESVSVPANMVVKNSYALRVRGESMIDDNIQDGDIIVIQKRESAENGQSVIAMINGEQVTLKKFYVERDGIRLQPANPEMEPIYLRNEDVQILGIVTGVIRSLN